MSPARAATLTYTDGQDRTTPVALTESSVFTIASGAATQSGAVSETVVTSGHSKTGAGKLTFTNSVNLSSLFSARDGTTTFTGSGSSLGAMIIAGLSAAQTPLLEVVGGSIQMGALTIGSTQFQGTLRVSGGGSVTQSGNLYIGNAVTTPVNGSGHLIVTGAGSVFTTSAIEAYVGRGGVGTLTLSDGGQFVSTSAQRQLRLGVPGGGPSSVGTPGGGGITVLATAPHGTVNIGAASGETAVAPGLLGFLQVVGDTGGGMIVFNHTSNSYYFTTDGTSTGAGIQVSGKVNLRFENGVTYLKEPNSHTGTNSILGGKVILANPLSATSLLGSGSVFIGEYGTLAGNGRVGGATTVAGTLAAGESAGFIIFDSSLEFQETSVLEIELGGTTRGVTHDAFNVAGLLTYGGTMNVSFINGFLPELGSSYDLFDGTYTPSSNFTDIVLANPGYTAVFNGVTGVLTITGVPEPSSAAFMILASVGLPRRRRK
jgi:T5SS/PEP-CTERM-associated repeat protein